MNLQTMYDDYLFHTMTKEEDVEHVEVYDKFQLLVVKKNGNRYLYDMMIHGERLLPPEKPVFSEMDEKTYTSEFGFILEPKIINKGITLEDLSEQTGISVATLYRYMRGDGIPNLYRAKRLADALGCDISEFFRIPK